MSEDFQAQIELLQDLVEVQQEFDAAYPDRKEDRERWNAAKAAYQEKRSFWRGINRMTTLVDESPETTVKADPFVSDLAIHKEEI